MKRFKYLLLEGKFYMKFLVVLLGCLMLVGCGPEILYSNLSESDANTMMGLLLVRNIQAVKTPQKENLFSISVPRQQFAAATDLLKWYGIPSEKFSGIGEVFKKTGIVSSPSEEKIRFMYALSQQISETLSHIDGVLVARVSLVLPKNDPYTETLTPSSASVFLKFRPGSVPPTLVPQIKTLVMKSVEGLNYDNVSVVIVQSESIDYYYPVNVQQEVSFFGIKIPKSALWNFWFVILGFIFISIALVVAVIFGKKIVLELLNKKSEIVSENKNPPDAPLSVPTLTVSPPVISSTDTEEKT
ncbi:MAG: EscJ/YscJ/HrcJ family type III secretion inner membrane ring protein [Verrucomicrobia bacterium]|nr:MAG: EscJ/YscJ/HrcJ family type III secretion inner membrane ring protein [Verrucomicrobiota bacterium]